MTQEQNTLVYLMFLSGILFLGLNFIAWLIVNPGARGSKRIGYLLIVSALLAFLVQQEYQTMVHLGFPPEKTWKILAGGFILPTFLVSMVFYRMQRSRRETSASNKPVRPDEP